MDNMSSTLAVVTHDCYANSSLVTYLSFVEVSISKKKELFIKYSRVNYLGVKEKAKDVSPSLTLCHAS